MLPFFSPFGTSFFLLIFLLRRFCARTQNCLPLNYPPAFHLQGSRSSLPATSSSGLYRLRCHSPSTTIRFPSRHLLLFPSYLTRYVCGNDDGSNDGGGNDDGSDDGGGNDDGSNNGGGGNDNGSNDGSGGNDDSGSNDDGGGDDLPPVAILTDGTRVLCAGYLKASKQRWGCIVGLHSRTVEVNLISLREDREGVAAGGGHTEHAYHFQLEYKFIHSLCGYNRAPHLV